MSPYRSSPSLACPHELRLAEPLPVAELVLVSNVFGPLFLWMCVCQSVVGLTIVAASGVLVFLLVLMFRHRAWLVIVPNEERLRVVRLRAWSYSASTLHLSDDMRVECSPIGNAMWLFVVARDGRAARVLPALSMRLVDDVEAFVKSCGTRPGTPSPR